MVTNRPDFRTPPSGANLPPLSSGRRNNLPLSGLLQISFSSESSGDHGLSSKRMQKSLFCFLCLISPLEVPDNLRSFVTKADGNENGAPTPLRDKDTVIRGFLVPPASAGNPLLLQDLHDDIRLELALRDMDNTRALLFCSGFLFRHDVFPFSSTPIRYHQPGLILYQTPKVLR